jgi:hypothetical protein
MSSVTILVTGSTADFSVSATPVTRTIAPGGSTSYTVNVSPLNGFNGTVSFNVSGLPTGPTATFSPTTVSGGGATTLTVTSVSSTTPGSYSLIVTASSGSLNHTSSVTLLINGSGSGGLLTGAFSIPAGTQNLTSQSSTDWAHWGFNTSSSFDHKGSVIPQISTYTVVGTGIPKRYSDNLIGYSWSDGTPTPIVNNSTTGVLIAGPNNGFTITAPADTTPRTLSVYVGAWKAQGTLTVHLSDGTATDYINSSITNTGGSRVGLYTLNYMAGSSGQTLSVTYTLVSGSGNVTLQAATLQ